MPVTLRDVAKRLDLSHATVSFVLNDRRDVAIPEKTRDRVKAMAAEMGYRPNRAAQALVKGRHDAVAVVTPLPLDEGGSALLRAVVAALRERHLEAIWLPDGVRAAELPPTVDGVLLLDGARDHGTASVMSVKVDAFPAAPGILGDVATELDSLLPGGSVVLGGRPDRDGELVVALATKLRDRGREVVTALHDDEAELVNALARLGRHSSIVVPDGRIGRRLLRVVDVAVVNLRGSEEDDWCSPTLTSYRLPVETVAAMAVERLAALLDARLRDESATPGRPLLTVRESTPPPIRLSQFA